MSADGRLDQVLDRVMDQVLGLCCNRKRRVTTAAAACACPLCARLLRVAAVSASRMPTVRPTPSERWACHQPIVQLGVFLPNVENSSRNAKPLTQSRNDCDLSVTERMFRRSIHVLEDWPDPKLESSCNRAILRVVLALGPTPTPIWKQKPSSFAVEDLSRGFA